MSLPSLPDKGSIPTRDEVVNMIIASIAMEELGLSHIINAEGEKLQYALGTIDGINGPETPATIEDLLELNKSIHQTLNGSMMNQFFLKEKLQNALSASTMQGPPGPPGPQGPATVTVNENVEELEPGKPPYVINENKDDPDNVVLKFGIPRGATGAVGTILDSFETLDKLKAAHSTGNQGDAYLVGNGDLYVWNMAKREWEKVGNLSGPAWEPEQQLFSISGTTGTGAVGYEDSLSFASNTLNISIEDGPTVRIENPAQTAGTLIPFATSPASVGKLSVRDRAATNVLITAFGTSSDPVSITPEGFTLPGGNGYFLPFTLAHEINVKSIYFTTANWYNFNPGAGTSVFPYIILATAAQGENNFTFIEETKTIVELPWQGGTEIPQNSSRYGSRKIDLDKSIPAGTRLAICCAFDTQGGDFPPFVDGYYFYFSGSIYYE